MLNHVMTFHFYAITFLFIKYLLLNVHPRVTTKNKPLFHFMSLILLRVPLNILFSFFVRTTDENIVHSFPFRRRMSVWRKIRRNANVALLVNAGNNNQFLPFLLPPKFQHTVPDF